MISIMVEKLLTAKSNCSEKLQRGEEGREKVREAADIQYFIRMQKGRLDYEVCRCITVCRKTTN